MNSLLENPVVVLSWWPAVAVCALPVLLWLAWRHGVRRPRLRLQAQVDTLRRRLGEQQAQLQRALDDSATAARAAEAADLAKTRFLAAASHDLRQPAQALGLYLAALRAGPLAPPQGELADRMAGALASLEALYGALLDVVRIDAGAAPPRWELVDLAPLLRRLAAEWAPAAEARGLRLVLRLPQGTAATVTDPLLLERVLRNLLSNAVKYTARGGVLLACRRRTGPDGTAGWRLEVWDTGAGIAAADRERIFEEFYRANPAPGGLGLGLAIVQRLLAQLHLRLGLHTRPGRGSVFSVEGLAPAGAAPLQVAAARGALRRLQGTVVAVLEDDDAVRDAMGRLLRAWDCTVLAGTTACDVLRQQGAGPPPQAVVADLHLGASRHGGSEAALLAVAAGCKLPLLLVSGRATAEEVAALQAAGHSVLAKPVSPARLRAWLEQAVAATDVEVSR